MIDKFLKAFLTDYFKSGHYKDFPFESVQYSSYQILGSSVFIYGITLINLDYGGWVDEYVRVEDKLVFDMLDLMAFIYSELLVRPKLQND